jgi:DNA-binding NtrC family response regulator
MNKVLVADDERGICEALSAVLAREGYQALIAGTGEEALDLVAREHPAVVLLDVQLPGMDGLETLCRIKADWPATVVVVMTAYGTVGTAMEAMRAGAFEYLGKPLELQPLRILLRRALAHAQAAVQGPEGNTDAVPALAASSAEPGLIGQSPAMQEVFKLMSLVAGNDLTVLITGESGVGKELVARGIHIHGERHAGPFVAVNCAAIPHHLLESELFGHERGAFTGAASLRRGRCETAAGGILFLDEIGELPYDLQGKMLRVLQERQFERLGSNTSIPLDARVLAATNRDLGLEVDAGRFREDLFHRINLVRLEVPPLRKRREDIELLARHFLALANRELNKDLREIEPAATAALLDYPWPGNVRELQNLIRKSVLLTQGHRLTVADLALPPAAGRDAPGQPRAGGEPETTALREAACDVLRRHLTETGGLPPAGLFEWITGVVEQALVAEALRLTAGNQVAASRLLGLSRTTLRKKLG